MTPIQVRLKELRKAKGWTQGTLADKANVRQATISEIESGKKQRIDLKILDRLCGALGVTPGDLLKRKGGQK